jgi:hyaluronan synthase
VKHEYDIPDVAIRRTRLWLPVLVIWLSLGLEAAHHADLLYRGAYRSLMIIWTITFGWSLWQLFLSWRDKPHTVRPEQQKALDKLSVSVVIPAYNEDPELLDRALHALFRQTRLPQQVIVVNDGSSQDYAEVRDYWSLCHPWRVEFIWIQQANRGKRHAQANGFQYARRADIFITLDSDTALERHAIEEGLKPFADQVVQSVAGLELAFNQNKNWLTRLNGVRQLAWQLSACSAQSVMGNVLVNRGTYALYRASLVRYHLDSYLTEDFFGHNVRFGDDSLLTTFAIGQGKAVQQVSAVQLTIYPENVDHHLRQWTRWMRSSTIRTFWRIRYLPLTSFGWWTTVINLWLFFASMFASAIAIAMWPVTGYFVADAIGAPVIWLYLAAVRIFIVKRSDEKLADVLDSFIVIPLAFVWLLAVLKPIRFWGMATCWQTDDWGTRNKGVEVEA